LLQKNTVHTAFDFESALNSSMVSYCSRSDQTIVFSRFVLHVCSRKQCEATGEDVAEPATPPVTEIQRPKRLTADVSQSPRVFNSGRRLSVDLPPVLSVSASDRRSTAVNAGYYKNVRWILYFFATNRVSRFTIADRIYGSLFFLIITGFHGIRVIM